MKILITTGLGERDIGGPFQYGPRLKEAFQELGHEVKLVSYGSAEKLLPPGLRHLYFLAKVFPKVWWAEAVLTLDTFSVGVPTAFASRVLRKKSIVRVGGDFLWSAFVNRTGEPLTLSKFYQSLPKLSYKEEKIFSFTKRFVENIGFLAFNTEWQRGLWASAYNVSEERSGVVRNFILETRVSGTPKTKNFLWAGRLIPEKNIDFLKRVAEKVVSQHPEFKLDIVTGEPHDSLLNKIKSAYSVVSSAHSDICPNFILEGISCGKPFIMTRETGLSELCPNGGTFIDPDDEEAWVKAFERMLEPAVYNRCVEELESLNLRHSWREIAEEYIEVWKQL